MGGDSMPTPEEIKRLEVISDQIRKGEPVSIDDACAAIIYQQNLRSKKKGLIESAEKLIAKYKQKITRLKKQKAGPERRIEKTIKEKDDKIQELSATCFGSAVVIGESKKQIAQLQAELNSVKYRDALEGQSALEERDNQIVKLQAEVEGYRKAFSDNQKVIKDVKKILSSFQILNQEKAYKIINQISDVIFSNENKQFKQMR